MYPMALIQEKTVFRFLCGSKIEIEKMTDEKRKETMFFVFYSYGIDMVSEYDLSDFGIQCKPYYKTLKEAKKESFRVMEEIRTKKAGN